MNYYVQALNVKENRDEFLLTYYQFYDKLLGPNAPTAIIFNSELNLRSFIQCNQKVTVHLFSFPLWSIETIIF